jgi:hypothetical protein
MMEAAVKEVTEVRIQEELDCMLELELETVAEELKVYTLSVPVKEDWLQLPMEHNLEV